MDHEMQKGCKTRRAGSLIAALVEQACQEAAAWGARGAGSRRESQGAACQAGQSQGRRRVGEAPSLGASQAAAGEASRPAGMAAEVLLAARVEGSSLAEEGPACPARSSRACRSSARRSDHRLSL